MQELAKTFWDLICNVEAQLLNDKTLKSLSQALERLKQCERDIVLLHYYDGLNLNRLQR